MCKKLNLEANKFIRGQVWFVREDPSVTKALRDAGSRVINGDRPWCIINIDGPMITCCPLTTNIGAIDPSSNDIGFKYTNNLGGGYSESRIIISQIQTKNDSEFEKYLYTFDDASVKEIMKAVCAQLGYYVIIDHLPTMIVSEDEKNERVEREHISIDKKTLPSEIIDKLELRLKGKRCKTEPVFRTKEEAIAFLDKWNTASGKEISNYFGVTLDAAYNWKYRAKAKAVDHG